MAVKKSPPHESGAPVKKVQPYPFEIEIAKGEGVPPIKGVVLKLTEVGFLMRVSGEHHFKVGENHKVKFEIPVLHLGFEEPVKVVKTYAAVDEIRHGPHGSKELHKSFTVEMHFRSLDEKKRKDILKFVAQIGQK